MVQLLGRIATGVEETNRRLDSSNERLDRLEVRMEAGFATLAAAQGESNRRLGKVEAGLEQTNARLDQGLSELRSAIGETNRRLGHIRDFAGERYREHRDHEQRLARLEGGS